MQSDFLPRLRLRQDRGGIPGSIHISQAPDCLSFETSPLRSCSRNARLRCITHMYIYYIYIRGGVRARERWVNERYEEKCRLRIAACESLELPMRLLCFVTIFQPFEYFWSKSLHSSTCFDNFLIAFPQPQIFILYIGNYMLSLYYISIRKLENYELPERDNSIQYLADKTAHCPRKRA